MHFILLLMELNPEFVKNSTLAITDRPIKIVIKKQTLTTNGMITSDDRGKHNDHLQIDIDVKNSVRNHINSIPRIKSHYCRKDSSFI